MDLAEANEARDDISEITSFELVRTDLRTKDDWAETTTVAASELSPTEEGTINLPTYQSATTLSKLRVWQDIMRPWLFYGRAVLIDTWWPEVAALTFSFACLVETTFTLRYYDGYPVSRLPLGLTLNTMLALLAAGSKSSLMLAVTATINQSKWCWLRSQRGERRRLEYLQVIEEASRGPLGSLMLLMGHTMTYLLYLGAIITVLSLTYEPFIQQVVTYPVQPFNSTFSAATTTRAFGIVPSTPFEFLQSSVVARILADIYGSSFPDHTSSCSTGNCTWDPFWSVDWCSKCTPTELVPSSCIIDTDEKVSLENQNTTKTCDFILSNTTMSGNPLKAAFGGTSGSLSLSYPLIWPLSVGTYNDTNETAITDYFKISANPLHHFLNEMNPLLALGFAAPNLSQNEANILVPSSIPAHICVLTPCSRTYNFSVTNGVALRRPLKEDYGTIFTNEGDGSLCWRPKDTNITWVAYDDGIQGPFDRDNRIWCGLDVSWIEKILSLFEGTYSTVWAQGAWELSTNFSYTGNYILDNNLSGVDYDPDVFMPNISRALTYLNLQGDASGTSYYLDSFPGMAFTDKTFVVVRWAWLSLPFTLNVFGLVFLVVTAVYSKRHRVPLWKSSAFALLYHGLDEDSLDDQKLYRKASDMEKAASTTYVKLTPLDGGRRRLILRS